MPLVDRYILRQARASFLLVLGVLTAVVWMTSSLRQLDLLVTQGQTILIFLGVTLLAIPLLLMLIAPFALFISFLFTLNKLNTDSELIVMSAAGMSQARLLRPLLVLAAVVTIAAWTLSLVIVPLSLRTLREAVTAARADFIGQVIQPGRFTTVDNGLTVHVRERTSNGLLLGVFVSDIRDAEVEMTYLGARGLIAKTDLGTFLVLEQGQIIRKPKNGSNGSLISFETYALNLSAFVGRGAVAIFPPQERWTWDLIAMAGQPQEDPRLPGRIRSEIHDRFAGPLYPLVFGLAAFAFLGRAQTTRQGRTESVVLAIITVVILRILGFMASGLAQREAAAVLLVYAIPIGSGAVFLAMGLSNWRRPTLPFAGLLERLPALPFRPRPQRG
jgi:lipopolysaccharide export system permease protein